MTPPVALGMSGRHLRARWRLPVARAVAWALLLGGWVGLGGVLLAVVARPAAGIVLMAGWLLAVGVCNEAIGRLALSRDRLRGLLCASALASAGALHAALLGGRSAAGSALPIIAIAMALLAWALLLVLASAVVRRCRRAHGAQPALPPASAALGALLAWGWLGDVTDLASLGTRLSLGVVAAGVLLAAWVPAGVGPPGHCRAGLFDCAGPVGLWADWRELRRWPLALASMVMLPMMCSLPLMLGLCRSDGVSARAALGLHLAAMFAPALVAGSGRRPGGGLLPAAPSACAALLAAGGVALWVLPGAAGSWVLMAAHGAAWSLAWTVRLQDRTPLPSRPGTALNAAMCSALFALVLALGIDRLGLGALSAWQMVLGAVGVALAALGLAQRVGRRTTLRCA